MSKVIIITGNSKRHMGFVERIAAHLDVVMVVSEVKFSYQKAFETESKDSIIERHFNNRDGFEAKYFNPQLPELDMRQVEKGWMKNNSALVDEIVQMRADAVLLFGSSIIKEPILSAYPNRVINLHLGLSPYYRGSGTNFWPIVDSKPECVGATIHLATLVVDAGDILHQVRPANLNDSDTIHDMGNKTMLSAFDAFPHVVKRYLNGEIKPVAQAYKSEIEFKRMQLNEESMQTAYSNMADGLLRDYLNNREARDMRYPIVEQL